MCACVCARVRMCVCLCGLCTSPQSDTAELNADRRSWHTTPHHTTPHHTTPHHTTPHHTTPYCASPPYAPHTLRLLGRRWGGLSSQYTHTHSVFLPSSLCPPLSLCVLPSCARAESLDLRAHLARASTSVPLSLSFSHSLSLSHTHSLTHAHVRR